MNILRYLSANYIFPVSSPPLCNGIVCVNDIGCIVDVTDTGGKLKEREKLEFYNGILVPGFVNAHCHLELSHLKGSIETLAGLPSFISSVGKKRNADAESIAIAAKAADEEMGRNGIVAVGDISNTDNTLNIKRKSRIYYHTFVELFGLDDFRADQIFATGVELQQKYVNARLSASITPHAVYSVSPTLWDTLSQSYQSSPPQVISIHHQESGEETNIFPEGKGELAAALREKGLLTGGRILSRDIWSQMIRCLSESPRSLLVHNTFTTKADLIKYQSQPERFYFVLCPKSNLFIQSRLPNFSLFCAPELRHNICLGTDSLASNTKLSILEEMKIIQQNAPEIPLSTLLQWATHNGARALGIEHLFGSFEKGKTSGVNLITGIDFSKMQLTASSEIKVIVK